MNRKTILFLFAIIIAGALAFIYLGVYNVAATSAHTKPVEWFMQTTMKESVQTRARGIEVPAGMNLSDHSLAEKAIGHYSTTCTPCHGAPGVEPAEWMNLNPEPPDLAERASQWKDAELFWIIKHGHQNVGNARHRSVA